MDQAILLALSDNVRLNNATNHVLTRYEMEAHVVRVLQEQPSSWAVRVMALYERSKLQCYDNYLRDRAVQQIEALVASLTGQRDAVLGVDVLVGSETHQEPEPQREPLSKTSLQVGAPSFFIKFQCSNDE